MASNLYVSTAEVFARIDAVNTSWSAAERTAMERVIEAVSRRADKHCGHPLRQFYQSSANTSRYFTAEDGSYLLLPDLVSIDTDGLLTDAGGDRVYEQTWATTDYDLAPFNASEVSEPYTYIEVTPNGKYSFPTHAKGVKITGTWGWPAIPPEVTEAVALESVRRWKQAQAPSGVIVADTLGRILVEPGWHATSLDLLAPFRRGILAGAA